METAAVETSTHAGRPVRGRRNLSLRARLITSYALVVAATLLVVSALTVQLTRAHLSESMDRSLLAAVASFKDSQARIVTRPQDLVEEARKWLATYAFSAEEVAAVRTASGEILSTVGGMDLEEIPGSAEMLVTTESRWWRVEGDESPIRLLTVPLVAGGRQIGTLLVATYETTMAATLNTLLLGVLWASGAGLALATLLAYISVGRALSPLAGMLVEVEAIESTGDLSRRVTRRSAADDEVGRLAEGFDRMLGRLEEAFRSQQRFLSDASHELRTPLAVARGHLELLEHGLHTTGARRSVTIAAEELDRMRRIVDDLLLLARLDEGLRLERQPIEVELILRETQLRAMLLENRPVTVNAEPDLRALGDPDRLLQVLTNLVTNAIQHSGAGSHITLSARREGLHVILKVSDSGQGINSDDLPHVFDRFYRGSTARAGTPGGAGLGLAIAASLVGAMDGQIRVSSTRGVGTTFTVTLQLAQDGLETRTPTAGRPALRRAPRKAGVPAGLITASQGIPIAPPD